MVITVTSSPDVNTGKVINILAGGDQCRAKPFDESVSYILHKGIIKANVIITNTSI